MATAGDLWRFRASGALSPAVSCEESERVLRDWRVWSRLQIRGVTNRCEGVIAGIIVQFAGRQTVSCGLAVDPAQICGEMRSVFGAAVYRKSTGGSRVGKSAAKHWRPRRTWHAIPVYAESLLSRGVPGAALVTRAVRAQMQIILGAGWKTRDYARDVHWASNSKRVIERGIKGVICGTSRPWNGDET